MRQTFCLVFSCHISSAPLMCKQAACLQTVWLPSPVPSVKFCPCATQYQAGCHFLGYLTSATTFFFHLKANWEQVEDHCSSHRSMAVAAGTGVPGQGFPLTLPELLRDTGRFEGQHHLLWQHSTCWVGPLLRTGTRNVINNHRYRHSIKRKNHPILASEPSLVALRDCLVLEKPIP